MARLAVLGEVGEADIDAEYERDRTASGAVHAARCRASRPDPAAKRRAWETIMADATSSNRLVVAAAEGFWHPGQEWLTSPMWSDTSARCRRRRGCVRRP